MTAEETRPERFAPLQPETMIPRLKGSVRNLAWRRGWRPPNPAGNREDTGFSETLPAGPADGQPCDAAEIVRLYREICEPAGLLLAWAHWEFPRPPQREWERVERSIRPHRDEAWWRKHFATLARSSWCRGSKGAPVGLAQAVDDWLINRAAIGGCDDRPRISGPRRGRTRIRAYVARHRPEETQAFVRRLLSQDRTWTVQELVEVGQRAGFAASALRAARKALGWIAKKVGDVWALFQLAIAPKSKTTKDENATRSEELRENHPRFSAPPERDLSNGTNSQGIPCTAPSVGKEGFQESIFEPVLEGQSRTEDRARARLEWAEEQARKSGGEAWMYYGPNDFPAPEVWNMPDCFKSGWLPPGRTLESCLRHGWILPEGVEEADLEPAAPATPPKPVRASETPPRPAPTPPPRPVAKPAPAPVASTPESVGSILSRLPGQLGDVISRCMARQPDHLKGEPGT